MTVSQSILRVLRMILITSLLLLTLGYLSLIAVEKYVIDTFSIEALKDIHLQVPLRVYTNDGAFIGEFGEQRRMPITFEQVPKMLVNAVLAAEDDRFFDHSGVDPKSLVRAIVNLLKTGEIQQGASTITMQLARNMFLSPQRNFTRKMKEMLYAQKMERELEKEKILELYLNKIYFGHRAYGISAAAQVYYNKSLQSLALHEMAMLAGMPQAPSANNPISNPESAIKRRDYVLRRMLGLGYIQQAQYDEAIKQPVVAQLSRIQVEAEMPYVAEMVRARIYECYGKEAYTGGYKVITTVDSKLQQFAQTALRNALWAYSERYGYYGRIGHKKLPHPLPEDKLKATADKILADYPRRGGLVPSLVLAVEKRKVKAYNAQGSFEIEWKDLAWARSVRLYKKRYKIGRYPKNAWQILQRGDIIMVRAMKTEDETTETTRWRLADIPRVEGAIVALNPSDGAILTSVGGFDFYHSKFNRVTQAERQPGSSFKPFIYSAALQRGFTPNTYIADTPLVIRAGHKTWKPRNYSHKFYGSISLRHALTHSFNVASVRLLMRIGLNPAIDHITRFGFKRDKIPRNLTIVLGTGTVTPLELTRGYTVFANGGHLIEPFLVRRIENTVGQVIYSANPLQVCQTCTPLNQVVESKPFGDQCLGRKVQQMQDKVKQLHYNFASYEQTINLAPRVISYNNAFAMTSILKDVIRSGTARRARALKRRDIAGKTGTTQEARDAWFVGYTPDIVTTTWVGFDTPRPLGQRETGGRAALPMWMDFMQNALKDKPEKLLAPSGDIETHLIANNSKANIYDSTPGYSVEESSRVTQTKRKPKKRGKPKNTRRTPRPKKKVVPVQLF